MEIIVILLDELTRSREGAGVCVLSILEKRSFTTGNPNSRLVDYVFPDTSQLSRSSLPKILAPEFSLPRWCKLPSDTAWVDRTGRHNLSGHSVPQ